MKKYLLSLFFIFLWCSNVFAVDQGQNKTEYFNKNVGIGITTPSEKLEVAGNIIGETFGNNALENVKFNNNQFMYTLDGSIYRPFQPTAEIIIYSEADFPIQDATTITLQDLYEYVISSTIYITKKFIFEDDARVRISGSGVFKGVLAYLGTDALFNANTDLTGEDLDTLNLFNVVCSAPSGTIFDIKNSINQNPTSIILIQTSSFVTVENLGKIENYNNFAEYVSFWLDCGYGLHLKDTKSISLSDIKMYGWKNYTTDFLKIDGELTDILYSSIVVFPQSNEYSLHITSSSFFTSVIGAGGIINSVLNGGTKDNFFNPVGFGKDNIDWTVKNVTKLEDSIAQCELYIDTATATTLVQDIPSKILGDFVGDPERFTTDITGRATYDGLEDIFVNVSVNPSAVVGAINQDIEFYFSLGNDTLNTITAVADQGGGICRITTTNAHGLTTGDRIPITNTTSYNDTYTITVIDTTNFDITETFVATETGNWQIVVEKSKTTNTITSTTKTSSTSMQTKINLSTNDFVECFVVNTSGNNTVTVRTMNILIN